MSEGVSTIIYPVKDLAKAKAMFSALLGKAPFADQPYYVGFQIGDQQIGLDPGGHGRGMTGPVPYCHVADIAGSLKALTDAGATVKQAATDVGGGRLIATVTDPDGNPIGLLQPGPGEKKG